MKKLIALAITGIVLLSPFTAFADDDLETRVAILEEKVAKLEAQLGIQEPETEADGDSYITERNGFTLKYTGCEVTQDWQGNSCVLLYFDFTNQSEDTRSAVEAFKVSVFQNGIEQQGYPILNDDPQELRSRGADVKPGADTIKVAWLEPITDMSAIDVSVTPMPSSGGETNEFTLSLE